jgi:hypothetical protein
MASENEDYIQKCSFKEVEDQLIRWSQRNVNVICRLNGTILWNYWALEFYQLLE